MIYLTERQESIVQKAWHASCSPYPGPSSPSPRGKNDRMKPRVSVVLTTYNGASRGYLVEAIESVFNQSYEDYELLIVDDGSTDHTRKQCSPFLDNPRVRYLHQENKGLAGARNTGIQASYGEFICFLDDDDVWKPEKLQRQIDFIEARLSRTDKWGLVYTWLELIDAQGIVISFRGKREEGSIYKKLVLENIIEAPSSVLVRREVFEDIGLFDESLISCEDWDMWLRISKKYLVFPVKEYLVQYREHQNTMSADFDRMLSSAMLVLDKVLQETPEKICPKRAYASLYLNRSVVFFAAEEYDSFRFFFFKGARLSLRAVTLGHLLLFVLSFTGVRTVRLVKTSKRKLQTLLKPWGLKVHG
jgi:glycosyltransferase involved in cell wall biosynthesis